MSDLSSTCRATVRRLRTDDRVTIADVARAAGVNKGTASRALRGFPNVGAATRCRVLDAAARLHFSASHVATALATGRSTTVGIVLPTLRSWFFRDIAAGASEVLTQAGYRVEVVNLDVDSDTIDAGRPEFRTLLTELGAGRDALLFAGAVVTEHGGDLAARLPVLAVGSPVTSVDGVVVDDRAGMRLLAEHLVALGHRDVALIDGRPPEHPDARMWARRTQGLRDGLEAHGLELAGDDVVRADGPWPENGERAVAELLGARGRTPTAIVCHTDELAFGVLSLLRRHGMSCPADTSVVGFDGHPMSRYWGLTTIDQHAHTQGVRAAQALLRTLQPERAASAEPLVRDDLGVELVVRETSGPPRARVVSRAVTHHSPDR